MTLPLLSRIVNLAGALTAILALPLTMIGMQAHYQIGGARLAGLGALAGLAILAAAALAVACGRAIGLARRPRLAGALQASGYALAVASLLGTGLALYHFTPWRAPGAWQLAALTAFGALMLAYARYGASERAFVTAMVARLGQLALLVPVALSPWIVKGAMTPHRLPESPAPLTAAPLEPGAPRRIVLVTFDALRQRSTGPAATPHLAALARESYVFNACRAAGERTLVSLSTLLSGVPPQHIFPRVESPTGYMRGGTATGLAGHLAPAGYRAAYATMYFRPEVFGMADEFAAGTMQAPFFPPNQLNTAAFLPWRALGGWLREKAVGLGPVETNPLLATRASFDTALGYLEDATGPTFTWVHVGVPHAPYYQVPKADLGGTLHPERYASVNAGEIDKRRLVPGEMERFEALYEDFVGFADAELGRFVAALRQDPAWADTMLIVTSDHGEEFQPIQTTHGKGFITEDVAHVPLIIHMPGQTQPVRIDTPVGHADVLPTVLDAVYAGPLPAFAGSSLLQPLSADRVVYTWGRFERYAAPEGHPHTVAAYQGRFKYRVMTFPRHEEHLFDLIADPRERHNVLAEHPEVAKRLRERVVSEGML